MKKLLIFVLVLSVLFVMSACDEQDSEETNGQTTTQQTEQQTETQTQVDPRDHVFVSVKPGENLPDPSDVGADYAVMEHRSELSFVKGLDFATFSTRWNQAAEMLNREDFILTEEFEFRYTPLAALCSYELLTKEFLGVDLHFLYLNIHVEYKTEYVWNLSAGYRIDQGMERIYDHEDILDHYKAMIYAANVQIETQQQLDAIVEQLGFFELEQEEFETLRLSETIDGYVYEISNSGKTFGSFQVSTE